MSIKGSSDLPWKHVNIPYNIIIYFLIFALYYVAASDKIAIFISIYACLHVARIRQHEL